MLDLLLKLGDGNIGTLTVLKKITQSEIENSDFVLYFLLRHNIIGDKIWILYKDYYKESIDSFVKAILNDSDQVIGYLNKI